MYIDLYLYRLQICGCEHTLASYLLKFIFKKSTHNHRQKHLPHIIYSIYNTLTIIYLVN